MTTRSTAHKLTLLGALYFAQGLPFGFFVQAIPVILRQAGWSLTEIGSAGLFALPWAFKFAWAPLLDRVWWPRLGRRRTWILSMQLAGVIVLGAIAALDATSIAVMLGATLVLNLIAATQDIATDGLGVELLDESERGTANGLQVGAYRIGMIAGGGVLLLFLPQLGMRGIFAAMAVLTALTSVPIAITREPPLPPAPPPEATGARHFLLRPGAWSLIALIFVYKLGESFGSAMLRPFLVDHGFDLHDLGLMLGTVGSVAAVAGAMTGGFLTTRIGRRRALVAFGIGQVVTVAGYTVLALTSPGLTAFYIWCSVEMFASAAATAALFTAMMDWSEPRSSGSDYTTQACTVVIAQILAGPIGGASAQHFGYATHFAIATALCALAVVLAYALFPKRSAPL